MNSSVLPYLASPISHHSLEFVSPDQLREVNGTEVFPVVEGIPLLQPPDQGHQRDILVLRKQGHA